MQAAAAARNARRRRALCAVALAAGLLVVAGPAPPARATVLLRVELAELARSSDVVVHARVVATRAARERIGGEAAIYTRVTLEVREWLAGGGAPGALVELVVHGGRVGDTVQSVPGQAVFARGDEVVVFLYRAAGVLWPNGMAQGCYRVVRDASGRAWVPTAPATFGATLVTFGGDGRLAPVPAAGAATGAPPAEPLDALRARVIAARAAP